jgi:hypothetical protein
MTSYYDDTDPSAEREAEDDERFWRTADADAEMRAMTRAANAAERARKRGICTHGSAVGYLNPPVYPEQEGLQPGEKRCTEHTAGCTRVFTSDEDWCIAMNEATGR